MWVPCDRNVVAEAAKALRNAAGNYYVNDKSTGSIVAQQPFGGARASGRGPPLLFLLGSRAEGGSLGGHHRRSKLLS